MFSGGEHNFSMNYDTVICDCGKTMTRETELRSSETIEDGDDHVFCTKDASFIISDDMRVAPYVVGSVLRILVQLGITDSKGAEMRSVTFGYNEIIDLLKGMLVSRTPLTDIILGRTQNNSEEVQKIKSSGVFLPKTDEAAASNSEKMMTLKVVIQRSTRVFLFAQAKGDFADFLFSLLTIPLGGALSLLASSTGITDTFGIEERSVTFGFNEIMDLLKGSLVSRAPLTELILDKNPMKHVAMKCEIGVLPVDLIKQLAETCSAKKMTVKAIVSSNKLLFAEVDASFVDFLFSLLAVPLGRIACLLRCDTCLNNIDNLYKSVENKSAEKYLKNKCKANALLLQPKLPFCYCSRNYFISPTDTDFPSLYFYQDMRCLSPLQSVNSSDGYWVNCYKFPEDQVAYSTYTLQNSRYLAWQEKYVKRQTMYMVTDDLTVTPLSSISGFSILNSLKIPLSEVKELELVVGLEEALSIMKASLTSSRALTDGLINPFLRKQLKQEG
ncbi:Protein of unknown function (DUF674 [Striga hermonthica]|uniref:DUF674 family protein n=1 Tax=Striga hermonthica TaxID=68872 RepID=A0A9N7MF35_STRHE|nr:Protein of unknown function (DUF674 [Striga hermonthica]